MTHVTQNQPDGTPTWIDLGIPDLERAMQFYGAVFGWEFDVGPEEYGHYTTCLLGGRRVAALAPTMDPTATEFWWNVYLATADLHATVQRFVDAGDDRCTPSTWAKDPDTVIAEATHPRHRTTQHTSDTDHQGVDAPVAEP